MSKTGRRFPDQQFLAIAADGTASRLCASGIRFPCTRETWVGLDFARPDPETLSLKLRCCSAAMASREAPRFKLALKAGNAVGVEVYAGEDRPSFQTSCWAVSYADLSGTVRDWLASSRTGDPLVDAVAAGGFGREVDAHSFRFEHKEHEWVDVVALSVDGGAVLDVSSVNLEQIEAGQSYRRLKLSIHPGAANTVSLCFQEADFHVVE